MSRIKVNVTAPVREIVKVSKQGPAGAPGLPGASGGSSLEITNDSGIALSAGRAVTLLGTGLVYSDNSIGATRDAYVGITVTAAATGSPVVIQEIGILDIVGATFTPNLPIYIGVNGFLTQTPPSLPAVYSKIVGTAITATRLFLTPRASINL